MKRAVKYLALLLSVIIAACICAAFSACSKSGGSGGDTAGSLYGKWDEYAGVKVGFVDEAAFNGGEIDESKVLPELSCKLGETWYMITDFDIRAPYDNDGRQTVTASVKMQPAAAAKATIQDTNSADTGNETKDDITELKAAYKIPEKANLVRNMRLVIQLEAIQSSEVYFDVSFYGTDGLQAVKTEKIEKTGTIEYTLGLKYVLTSQKGWTYEVSEGNDKSVKSIDIPYMINKTHVATIKGGAFKNCSELKSIVIPTSVTSILKGAFVGCEKLESITIPFVGGGIDPSWGNRLSTKFEYIFSSKLPNSLNTVIISGKSDIYDEAFKGCSGLKNISILNGVTRINYNAFNGCSGLTNITLPNSVTSIGEWAFNGCSGLTSITIPDSITNIGIGAFNSCDNLQYYEYDNALYLGNENNKYVALIKANNTDYCSINKDTKIIVDGAFKSCNKLTSITILNGLHRIGDSVFEDCIGLTSITIPDSVTSIDWHAFNFCRSLESIIFEGTMAQWQAIEKGYDWDRDTGSYTVRCTDGDLTKEEAG